jgi:hypothetical protein
MEARLFGSRATGKAQPNSDWDVIITDQRLAGVIPQPFFTHIPGLYDTGPENFYLTARKWSLECLAALGGERGLEALKEEAKRQLNIVADNSSIDLFLHMPPAYGEDVWAIRLKFAWDEVLSSCWPKMMATVIGNPRYLLSAQVHAELEIIVGYHKGLGYSYKQHFHAIENLRRIINMPTVPIVELSYFALLERGDKHHSQRTSLTELY